MRPGVGLADPETDWHVDSLEDLDEHWRIPCEIPALSRQHGGGYPHCDGEPAVWIAWKVGCCGPNHRLVCESCRKVYENWKAHQASIVCGACKTETGGFVRYTPLNGR